MEQTSMKIIIDPEVFATLEEIRFATRGHEFSGFGYAEWRDQNLYMYDFVLLDVGSWSYTEIKTPQLLELMERPDRQNMRVWVHLHPMGSGKPGPVNWSVVDVKTIKTRPLGGIPELVQWSASIVRTPYGWVGRLDNHIKDTTTHVEVEPRFVKDTVLEAVMILVTKTHAADDDDDEWFDDELDNMEYAERYLEFVEANE